MEKRRFVFQELGIGVALVVLVFLIQGIELTRQWIRHEELHVGFLSPVNRATIVREAALFAIMGIGETLVIISGGIDLSPGSMVALMGVVVTLLLRTPLGHAGAVAGTLGCAALIGAWHGLFVTKMRIPAFVITLGTLAIARDLATGLCMVADPFHAAQPIPAPPAFIALWGNSDVFLWMLLLGLAVLFTLVMNATRFGRYVYAVGGNMEAARLSGTAVDRVRMGCYVVSAMLASVSGLLVAGQVQQGNPSVGSAYELYAIAAVVVGGTSLMGGRGTVLGTVLGAGIISVIRNCPMFIGIPTYWQGVVVGAVVVLTVTLDTLRRRGR